MRRRHDSFSREDLAQAGTSGDQPVDDDGVLDLMDLEIPEEQGEQIKKTLQEKTKYKEVAPTWELNIETYGYGKRRKTYDPDYEHVESAKFREYERLEVEGYEEMVKTLRWFFLIKYHKIKYFLLQNVNPLSFFNSSKLYLSKNLVL